MQSPRAIVVPGPAPALGLAVGLILAAALISIPPAAAADAELTPRAAEYLRKLAEFESDKVKALKAELWEKRAQVVALLQREQLELTKKGDLEGALALKAAIGKLGGEVDLAAIKAPAPEQSQAQSQTPQQMSPSEAQKALEKSLIGQTWKCEPDGVRYHFEKRGKATKNDIPPNTEHWSHEWKVTGPNVVEMIVFLPGPRASDLSYKFTFTSETEAKRERFNDGELTGTWPATLEEPE